VISSFVRQCLGAVQRRHFRRVVYVSIMADVPIELSRRTLYVVGPLARPKWAVFDCPRADGHRVALDLSPSHLPSWRLVVDRGRPTIWPSVDVRAGKRCHFFVRGGRIVNVRDRGDHGFPL
jgi:hypothetical protein